MSDPHPRLMIFDVNETLSDMSPLQGRFEDVGLPSHAAATWFASLLRDGFALTSTGANPTFADLAQESLLVTMAGQVPESDRAASAEHVLAGLKSLALHADVADGVRRLHAAGRRLVTLSNGSARIAADLMEAAGIADLFETLLSVEDAPRWKPAPEAYGHALEVCGVDDPAEAMLVAVHPWDIHGAHEAGLRTAWINRRGGHYPAYCAAPDVEATSIDDLARRLEERADGR